ncbi:hypothetical protein BV202_01338B, partial [Haemophilus influenzae]
NYNKKPLLV